MGYTTEFYGAVEIYPPLNEKEKEFLQKFSDSRRMDRKNGPYYVEDSSFLGQSDIYDYNRPPPGQPDLWCHWEPSEDGTKIEWNGAEKFYHAFEWMEYIINHFVGSNPLAKNELPFLEKHVVHGVIEAQGQERSDHWYLIVENNQVRTEAVQKSGVNIQPLDKIVLEKLEKSDTNDNVENKDNITTEQKDIYKKKTSRFNL